LEDIFSYLDTIYDRDDGRTHRHRPAAKIAQSSAIVSMLIAYVYVQRKRGKTNEVISFKRKVCSLDTRINGLRSAVLLARKWAVYIDSLRYT